MNYPEVELEVDAENIMWMYHLKFFIELRRKYDTFIKFRGHRAYLEGQDLERIRIAAETVKRRATQEFVYDFLMESNNPNESYSPFMDLLSNQEYEQLKKQFQGLYIFTKKQFMNIKSELSVKYGYVANFSRPYPLNYVIIWLPQNKQSFLYSKIITLVQIICKSIEQGVTPMNAQYFSYRNRDLANRDVFHKKTTAKVTDFQAIQIFMIFDIRKIEEHFQISLSLTDRGGYVQLVIQGQSDYNCNDAMKTLENHIQNKVLLQMPFESRDLLENERRKVIQSSDIEALANRLDQLFETNILQRITSHLGKSVFVFVETSEIIPLRLKVRGENHSSTFTNSDLASELVKQDISNNGSAQILYKPKEFLQKIENNETLRPPEDYSFKQNIQSGFYKQEPRQLRVIKDVKIETREDAVIIEFFNYHEGVSFYLFQNNFNEQEFQKDFDEYFVFHYSFPHLIQPDYSVQNQLKFKIEIFDKDQKKVIVQIKDFLEHYMNYKIVLGVKGLILKGSEEFEQLEELVDDYNCKLTTYKCDLSSKQVGWLEDNEPEENEKGRDSILIITNLIHCFVKQVKQKINQIIQQQHSKIITLLFESQFDNAYNLASFKKLDLFCHFYLEDCYWVQIEGKDPKSVIEIIKNNDEAVLETVLEKLHIKQTESILQTQQTEHCDSYDVFIKEQSQAYYSKLRRDYLTQCLSEEEWKNVQFTTDETLFYVNVTDLNIDPLLSEPLICEIANFGKPGRQYEKLTELDIGMYLIGRARNVQSQEFSLKECSHLVRYFSSYIQSSIVNIK